MTKEDSVKAVGKSGQEYTFNVYPWGTLFKPLGGIYLVLKKLPNGNYDVIYVGQTGDFSERFDAHHKQHCFDRNGKTHIGIHQEGSEQRRLFKEADLIDNYNPICNG
nr:hypothetical protein [uncultured Desulfuromonas sp.]